MLGDMHENVEALHRSIQKQTDDATKSRDAFDRCFDQQSWVLRHRGVMENLSIRGRRVATLQRGAWQAIGQPNSLDVHTPLWQPEELSKSAGTHARLRGGPAFGHVFAGARHASAEHLELGHRNQRRASVLGECGRPRLHGEAQCPAENNVGDYLYVPAGFLA